MEGLGHRAQKLKVYPVRNGKARTVKTSLKVIPKNGVIYTSHTFS